MNLGIERCSLGDILIEDGKSNPVCQGGIGGLYYGTSDQDPTHYGKDLYSAVAFEDSYEPRYEELKGTVASVRLDTVLSLAYPLSRSKVTGLIEGARVFVNGKLVTSNGYRLKEGDILSVRKMGRIGYNGIPSETKKGHAYMVSIRKYI